MKIKLANIFVDDQAKALTFYTNLFGFVKKNDIDLADFRWLTVVSQNGPISPGADTNTRRPKDRRF